MIRRCLGNRTGTVLANYWLNRRQTAGAAASSALFLALFADQNSLADRGIVLGFF